MCGILGVINSNISKLDFEKALLTQNHRGPDYTGYWESDSVKLGHNRLSIIDLSSIANQPFVSSHNRFVIVFNGEIYNYKELKEQLSSDYNFVTNSDTEVLLAAYIKWGKHCLSKLNGMFSFSIWDKEKKELFAARDRFGVKPFYYSLAEDSFLFASEIKALHSLGVDKKINEKVWAEYFAYGSYGMPTETFWSNVKQLAAGHYLEYKDKQLKIDKWYSFVDSVKQKQEDLKNLTSKEVKDRYEAILKDSIKLRFRADVTIGFNISGGLDSSTLLTYVNLFENKQHIQAYTFYTGNENYDELPWVKEMLSHTNNPLTSVKLEANEVENMCNHISRIQDEPYGGIPTLAYSKIFEKARKDNVLVLLDGQGMDEQWAGYDYYFNAIDTLVQGVKKSPLRPNVLKKYFLNSVSKPVYPEPFKDRLLNLQYRDLFFTKIPRALRFNDRVSMAFSTELREPFLDYRLVEFAFSLPEKFKRKNQNQKYLLRELVSEHLSDSITYAPKRPLQTPQREWLGEELKDFVNRQIDLIENSIFVNYFNLKELRKEWDLYCNGDTDSSFHIWQWISFALMIKGMEEN